MNLHKFQYSTYLIEEPNGGAYQVAGYRHEVIEILMETYGYDFYSLNIYEL